MKTLDELGLESGTDKASNGHNYLSFYEMIFRDWRSRSMNILEIGVQFGHSLKTWSAYFSLSDIYGIDSVDNEINLAERTQIYIADAYLEMTPRLLPKFPFYFHIIIDDGSHYPDDQKKFCSIYSSLLAHDGILIVEDLLGTDHDLHKHIPSHLNHATVDLRVEGGLADSILFMAWNPK